MTLSEMTHRDVLQALALWNAHRGDVGFPYDELGEKSFRSLFIDNGSRTVKVEEGGIMTGFCSAYSKTEYLNGEDYDNTPLYLTITLADDDEAGDMLVEDVVSYARSVGKRSIAATYRNPVMLPWSMSDGKGMYHHNNAPGVPAGSIWQSLLERHGFDVCRLECGLYYPLPGYSIPPHVLDIEKALSEDGIGVVMYDRSRHHGFDELFDALHGEVWRRTIEDNERLASPLPVLVAVHDNLIIGFAGPIACERNGRGWFNGVAVHPDWQRRGIARVLFSRLLGVFHDIGAGYSTIFTDEGNPALHLYESIGFRTGGRFAVMERMV